MRLVLLPLLLIGCAHPNERPTETGDVIGSATMLADGTIQMMLRSVECDGTIAHGTSTIRSSDAGYGPTIARFPGIKPGDTQPITAGKTTPCAK